MAVVSVLAMELGNLLSLVERGETDRATGCALQESLVHLHHRQQIELVTEWVNGISAV